uniref:Uncharacterized protein n=1 Tax=Panagrolaimus sp. ES5 TaxID=591445 RepID=A0AC34GV03_9BILA
MDSIDSTMIPSDEEINVPCTLGLPESILYYIKNKAHPRFQLKLMQTSKYFRFKEFPYSVARDIGYADYDDTWYFRQNNGTYEDIEILTKPLWITGSIYSVDAEEDPKAISDLLSKCAVCDIKKLNLCNQILTVGEFRMLVSSDNIEKLYYHNSHIEYDDGSIVWFDEIIKVFPKLKKFGCTFNDKMASTFTPDMTKTMIDYVDTEILEVFIMINIPEAFDFKLFANFMEANPSIKFRLEWSHSVSDEYTQMLQDYVDELIETSSYKNRKVLICFDCLNYETLHLLDRRYYSKT